MFAQVVASMIILITAVPSDVFGNFLYLMPVRRWHSKCQ